MTPNSPQQFDRESMFWWWFNDGRRRTLTAVAEQYQAGYTTVRKIADDEDWDNRADAIDDDARRIQAKRVARTIAETRVRAIEGLAVIIGRFNGYRLLPRGADGKWTVEALRPEEIGVNDYATAIKIFELLTGGATVRVAGEDRNLVLDELEREIAALDREGGSDVEETPGEAG